MNPNLQKFLEIVEKELRDDALVFILNLLEKEEMTFFEVYEEILGPSLNQMKSTGDPNIDIWNEHIRTSIIKTIVENCYHYVIRERHDIHAEKNGKTVVVFCPPNEYHSVGARMVTDIFTYLGFTAVFIGGNTPFRVLEAGLKSRKIDYVAISVSNPYHLVSTRNMIQDIRRINPDVKIVIGGHAVQRFGERAQSLQADYIMTTFQELETLEGGKHDETGL